MVSKPAECILDYVKSGVRISRLSTYLGFDVDGDGGMWSLCREGDNQLRLTCHDPVVLEEVINSIKEAGHTVEEAVEPCHTVVITIAPN